MFRGKLFEKRVKVSVWKVFVSWELESIANTNIMLHRRVCELSPWNFVGVYKEREVGYLMALNESERLKPYWLLHTEALPAPLSHIYYCTLEGQRITFILWGAKDEIMSILRHISKGIICHDHFSEELKCFHSLCNSHWIKYCVPQTLIKGGILFCNVCHTECFLFKFIDSSIYVLGFINLFIPLV